MIRGVIIAIGLATQLAAAPSFGQDIMRGAGTLPCSDLDDFLKVPDLRSQIFQWFLGFGSGINAQGDILKVATYRNLSVADEETVFAHLRVGCSKTPEQGFLAGMFDAYIALPPIAHER